jgi:hypothetical protein
MDFMNIWALYFLALLIPLIILYLLKPKPKDLKIPSLMFIKEIEQRKRFRSFFKKIVRDPLLIIQILTILLLVLAASNPFYTTEEEVQIDKEIAIVLDASASMQAQNRFAEAKGIASSILDDLGSDDKVSLVLSENIPLVAIRRGDKGSVSSALGAMDAKATPTGIGGAMLLASDIIKESNVQKEMYVISDFSNYEGTDPLAAQKTASSNGISVEFIRVGSNTKNIAITGSRSGRSGSQCFMEALVKNYGQHGEKVKVNLVLDGQSAASESKEIGPMLSEVFYLSSDCLGSEYRAEMEVVNQDSMGVDNRAYAIIPAEKDVEVLLIREEGSSAYLSHALDALKAVSFTESNPPVYPQSYDVYDTIIFQSSKPQNVLPGTFSDLRDFVEKGGNLIVFGFEGLEKIDKNKFENLLPVKPKSMLHSVSNPHVLFEHQMIKDVDLEKISVREIMQSDAKRGSVTLAEVVTNPFLTMWDVGDGKVIYLGLSGNSSGNDFYLKPSFPVFWHQALSWLNREEGVSSLNFRTGEQLPSLGNQSVSVKRPSGQSVEGKNIMLDEAGFYEIEGSERLVAASLIDEKESNILDSIDMASAKVEEDYDADTNKEKRDNELFWALAAIGVILLTLEWFYYRRRGSL